MGFEPTDAFTSPVFKTGAFNHSAISPCAQKHDRLKRRTYSITLRAACQRISELPGMFFCSLSRERRKKGRERLYKPPALCYTMYKPWSIHGLFVCCAGPMGPCVHVEPGHAGGPLPPRASLLIHTADGRDSRTPAAMQGRPADGCVPVFLRPFCGVCRGENNPL